MGPNGSEKYVGNVLSGKNGCKISGQLNFGKNLESIPQMNELKRYFTFQYPIEIPVNMKNFLKTSLNKVRKAERKELDTLSFLKLIKEKSQELGIDEKMLLDN